MPITRTTGTLYAGRVPLLALVAANAVSLTGNVLAAVAIPWFVLITTGSAARTGLAAFFMTLPFAAGAFLGGAVVDRVGARRASVVADLASGLTIAFVPLLHAADRLEFWHLVALAFASSALDAPGAAARKALLPELAARAGTPLERANGLYTSAEHVGYVLGAPLAGVLIVGVGAANVLWVDAASFAVSAAAVGLAVPVIAVTAGPAGYLAGILEALRFLRKERVVLMLMLVATAGNFLASWIAPVVLPVYAREVLDSALGLGLMTGAFGAGGILGTLGFGALGHRLPRRALYAACWISYPVLFAGIAALPGLALVLALLFAFGLFAGALVPLEQTVVQERIPPALRARVLGTEISARMASAPLGVLVAGFVLEGIGLKAGLLVLTGGWAVLALVAVTTRAARSL